MEIFTAFFIFWVYFDQVYIKNPPFVAEGGIIVYIGRSKLRFIDFEQVFYGHREYLGKRDHLDIRDESLTGLYALNSVLVDIKINDLKPVCELSLRDPESLAELGDIDAANVISSAFGSVIKHEDTPLL